MEYKVFNDPIHGHMRFHPLLIVVIDTPQFQRLRNIRQLGPCHFVYPSATHTRFEHSLGTAYIAGKLFDSLRAMRLPSDIVSEAEWGKRKLMVQMAGLCHDLGHGPFSHTWEKFRHRMSADDKWTHEEESLLIFDQLLGEDISPRKSFNGRKLNVVRQAFRFYGLGDLEVKQIKLMIQGSKEPKNYMFQIINNKFNRIDVDKWDYLARDSFMLNLPIAFDYRRLLNFCCILKNEDGHEELCFREKECALLLDMFLARGRLHDKAYQHTKVKVIEEMLVDALVLASDRLKLLETPVTELTDHIYQKILYDDFGRDKNMKKAKEILQRIERRNLYKCIARESFEGKPNLKKIKDQLKKMPDLNPFIDDIGLCLVKLDMTKTNKGRTLKNVQVYSQIEGPDCRSRIFDWQNFQDSIKPNMEDLKRHQVLVLYKGKNEFPEDLRARFTGLLWNMLANHVN